MSLAGTASIIGTIGSVAASYLQSSAQNKAIEAQNALYEKQFDQALQVVRDQLSVAYNRTQIGLDEVNRDRISNKLATRKAQSKSAGTAIVKAAQIGVSGKRGQGLLTQEIDREAENAISDTDIASEVQLNNIVNAFNDSAKAAIANLNANAPVYGDTTSGVNSVISAIGSGVNYFDGLSDNQKTDVLSNFNIKQNTNTGSGALSILDGATDYSNYS